MTFLGRKRVRRPGVTMRLARQEDDRDLRRLLQENGMPGLIPLALEREPSYFQGESIVGDEHQTIVAHDRETSRLVGLGGFSVRRAWLNGCVGRLGYLSQLRIERGYRGTGSLLRRGFNLFRELHPQTGVDYYITTIFASNRLGRLVLERDRDWKPYYRRRGVLSSLVLPLWRPRVVKRPMGVVIRRGTADDLPAIAACLQRNYSRFQFAPQWTADDLADDELTRGLAPEDFVVALRGGQLMGCLALWDQQGFKQTVVHGYRGGLGVARRFLNWGGAYAGWPQLPAPGEALRHAYVSHVAVDDDEGPVYRALLGEAYNAAKESGSIYLALGFDTRHPFCRLSKFSFPHIEYRAILYVSYWDSGAFAASALDKRLPHVEIAVL